ncbi:hypothetical protein MNBD_BACTEROID02-1330 [hydrothermal vent metagenome]|uniref:Uncharacterized protein n=1 Tax=hydrothermal vent metagenome TaxID=652676 RepID=A0A3B0QZ54_9ZZZZ
MGKDFCNAYTKQLFIHLVDVHTSKSKRSKIEFAKLIGKRYNWVCDKYRGVDSISFEKLMHILFLLGYKNLNEIDLPLRHLEKSESILEKRQKRKANKVNSKKRKGIEKLDRGNDSELIKRLIQDNL